MQGAAIYGWKQDRNNQTAKDWPCHTLQKNGNIQTLATYTSKRKNSSYIGSDSSIWELFFTIL